MIKLSFPTFTAGQQFMVHIREAGLQAVMVDRGVCDFEVSIKADIYCRSIEASELDGLFCVSDPMTKAIAFALSMRVPVNDLIALAHDMATDTGPTGDDSPDYYRMAIDRQLDQQHDELQTKPFAVA